MAEPLEAPPLAPATAARNTAFALAIQLTSAAFTAVTTLYLVRKLGASGYGVFALAVGIGTLVALAADLGITQSAERFIAERRADRGQVRAVVLDALRLKLVAAAVVCGGLVALAVPIANAYGNDELVWPLRAVALAVLGQSTMFLYRGTFVALGRVVLGWRMTAIESAVEAAATIAIVAAGAGAAGAAWGRAAGYCVGAAIGALLLQRALGRRGRAPAGRGPGRRRLARYAGVLLIVNAAFTVFEQIDVVLIGAIVSTTAVGVFEAPLRLTVFLGYAGQALAFGVAPRLARGGEGKPDVRSFESALRYLLLVQAALLAPVLVWATPIVDLVLGDGYGQSAGVLRTLAPFVMMSAIGTFVTLAVNYLGEASRRVPLALAAVLVNVVIDLALIPQIGVLGGAVGTDVAFGLYVAGHLWICRRLLGFDPRPLVRVAAAALAAAAVMAAVLAVFGTSALSAPEWIAGGLLGLAAYVAVLVVTGTVSGDEVARLVRLLRAPRQAGDPSG